MTENYNDMKWNTFEASGKITDYLQYKGINSKTFTDMKNQMAEDRVQNTDGASFSL
ncbi:MAG: hypothetical protein LBL98_06965 [Ruminococcus sp.]|jgi:hypothetical protein|nr:hypothetical protein [Ruminococcus sp.]